MNMLQRMAELESRLEEFKTLVDSVKHVPSLVEQLKAEQAQAIKDGNAELFEKTTEAIEEKYAEFGKVAKRMDEFEKFSGRKGLFGNGDEKRKGFVEQLTESDSYKAFKKNPKSLTFDRVNVKRPPRQRRSLARKGLFDSGPTGSEPFAGEMWVDPGLEPYEEPVLMQVMRTVDLGQNASVRYPEFTKILYLETELAANVLGTDTTVQVNNAAGVKVGSTLKFNNDDAKTAIVDSVNLDTNVITLTAQTGFTATSGQVVTSEELTFTPESTDGKIRYAPKISTATVEKTANLYTITADYDTTRQALEWAPIVQMYFEVFLLRALNDGIDRTGLYGEGTGAEWQGIMTHPSALSYAWSEGVIGDRKMDAIRRSSTVARLANYRPNAVLLHPLDLEDIELTKDDNGAYILINAVVSTGISVLWRLRVFETQQIKEGDFLVADFQQLGFFFTTDDIQIGASREHDKNYTAHMTTLLAYQDIGFVLWHPSAAVVGEFDAAPS